MTTDPKCANCKHWERGTITVFHPQAVEWDGRPHWKAGQTEINRPRWDCHKPDQDVGTCGLSLGGECGAGSLMVATCWSEGIYGELVTDASWGCQLFEPAPEGGDHYRHIEYNQTRRTDGH